MGDQRDVFLGSFQNILIPGWEWLTFKHGRGMPGEDLGESVPNQYRLLTAELFNPIRILLDGGLIQEIGNGLVVRAVRLQFQLAVGHWLIGCSAVITRLSAWAG